MIIRSLFAFLAMGMASSGVAAPTIDIPTSNPDINYISRKTKAAIRSFASSGGM